MKYATLIFLMLMSTIANAIEVDYWHGLEYDYSNAKAYQIKLASDKVSIGIIAVTSQLYSYGNGRYTVIPSNAGLSIGKPLGNETLNFKVGISYWVNKNMIFTDRLNYELNLHYQIKNNLALDIKHYGLSSITRSDSGLNLFSLSYTF